MASRRQILRFLRTRVGPWVIWISTVAAVIVLYADVHDRGRVLGFAYGIEYKIAAPAAGRIKSVAVEIGQSVKKGDVIAVLDASQTEANIRENEGEKRKLKAEIKARESEVRQRSAGLSRELDVAIERSAFALNQSQADLRIKSAELKALSQQRTRLRRLIKRQLAPARNLTELDIRHASLTSEKSTLSSAIALIRKQLAAATTRRAALPPDDTEVAVAPLREEILVIDSRLAHLRHQKSNLVLRAPANGQVYRVIARPGDVAAAGQTIVRLIGSKSDRVVACVSEYEALSVKIGAKATLHRRDMSGQILKGHVMSMGPIVDEVPVRCRRDPRLPAWGRDVVIVLDEPAPLLPGQAFYVSIAKDFKSAGHAVAATPSATEEPPPADAPLMVVPAPLKRQSRLEPSGLLWVDSLDRYLMVSDDTGTKAAHDHAPWLFTMDRHGHVDANPRILKGIESVNDLEAITSLTDGLFYILASQSHSRKGKRKKNRQVFLRVALAGTELRVVGVQHLASLLDGAGPSFLAKLGIDSTAQLDIEGMTVRDGSLLIGLKEPLDAEGRAIIWKLDFPDRLFATGDIRTCGLSWWTSVAMEVKADGTSVKGGISELLTLPDGSLLIGATASGIDADTQDGALYLARTPTSNTMLARQLRAFPGLKPEGLALSPTPGRFTVVFDRGSRTPSWLELPWPRQ